MGWEFKAASLPVLENAAWDITLILANLQPKVARLSSKVRQKLLQCFYSTS